jgi:hypothetical protein
MVSSADWLPSLSILIVTVRVHLFSVARLRAQRPLAVNFG